MANNVTKIAIIAVAIVVIAGAGVGIAYGMGAFNKEKEANAADLAKSFVDSYGEGKFGKFTVEEGASKEKAVLNSVVEKYINDPGSNSVNRFTIYAFSSTEDAEKKYNELLESFPASLSMYTVLETIELNSENGASDYHCDKGKLMFTTYLGSSKGGKDPTKTAASQTFCLMLKGKYVIDCSQSIPKNADAGENVRLYYGLPITDKYEATQQISFDNMKTYVKDFMKAF